MYLGFLLAAYSVVGNDVIQTLGTFLSSNQHKVPWWVLSLFAATILTVVLVYGWATNGGDVSYGRLLGAGGFNDPKYAAPAQIEGFGWPYLLPPLILLIITRFGIPVSTSFLILTFFNPKNLQGMVEKSMLGYLVAFVTAILLYGLIARRLEKQWLTNEITKERARIWTFAQWISTGLLWSQWLIQDFANIYVYLPRSIDMPTLLATLVVFWLLIGYIFYAKGGAIQSIVLSKTNTTDIRSATVIDLTFAAILFFFKEYNKVPMSTTWVFLGLLAGRELGIKYFISKEVPKATWSDVGKDLLRVFFGLCISIALVYLVKWILSF